MMKNKFEDAYYRVRRVVVKPLELYRSFRRFLRNLWYYKGWLWNGVDFDYTSLLDVQALWLESLIKHYQVCAVGRDAKRIKEVQKAVDLLRAIREDEFCKEEWKVHNEKWGELQMNTSLNGDDLYECLFFRKNANTQEEKKQELKESRKLWNLEIKRRKTAERKLFTHMHKYYSGWWC